jgi:hypothetical protein
MSRTDPPDDFRPEDYPIAWFAEMLIALERGEFQRAAESQQRLERLGWRVSPKGIGPMSRRPAARPGGVSP